MGFAPDTVYTCSVFASTGAGDGPSVNRTVRTLEAGKIFVQELSGLCCLSHTIFVSCSP